MPWADRNRPGVRILWFQAFLAFVFILVMAVSQIHW